MNRSHHVDRSDQKTHFGPNSMVHSGQKDRFHLESHLDRSILLGRLHR